MFNINNPVVAGVVVGLMALAATYLIVTHPEPLPKPAPLVLVAPVLEPVCYKLVCPK